MAAEPDQDTIQISVISPFFNEEGSIRELYTRLTETLDRLGRSYELVFVDDGSTDGTADKLADAVGDNPAVTILRLRRNRGKSEALAAGFNHAVGEYMITIDADLQDDPDEIPRLVEKLDEGFELVCGWKKERKDPGSKTVPSKVFNTVTSLMTGVKLHDMNCGLKAYRRYVIDELEIYGGLHRYIPVLAHSHGFRICEVEVKHHPRRHGKSKFGSGRLVSGFFDLFTVIVTTRFLARPLHFFGPTGLLCVAAGVAIGIGLLVWKYGFDNAITANTRAILLLVLGIVLGLVGLLFFSIGLIGELMYRVSRLRGPIRPVVVKAGERRSTDKP
jgi:glycosyltransferase involved in cell wall biosynthesis